MRAHALISWIRVADVDRARAFYEAGLGARLALDQGDCVVLAIGDAWLGLCTRPEPRQTPGLLLCFLTEDVSATTAALVRAGATLEQAPAIHERYRIAHAFLRDLDGHRLEVQRFLDPDALA